MARCLRLHADSSDWDHHAMTDTASDHADDRHGDRAAQARLTGRPLPDVTLRLADPPHEKIGSRAFVGSGRVALIGLPGAFTPTCTGLHVPRFEELADELAQAGVSRILCTAVNDAFVMDAWRHSLRTTRIEYAGDGNGDLHRALGLLRDMRDEGMGERARRYTMLVRDGTIEKAWVEADEAGDPFAVTTADVMLHHLRPDAHPLDVMVFTRPNCGWSRRALQALDAAHIPYRTAEVGPRGLRGVAGRQTTPQVFVDGEHIGGCEDLEAWLRRRGAQDSRAPQ